MDIDRGLRGQEEPMKHPEENTHPYRDEPQPPILRKDEPCPPKPGSSIEQTLEPGGGSDTVVDAKKPPQVTD